MTSSITLMSQDYVSVGFSFAGNGSKDIIDCLVNVSVEDAKPQLEIVVQARPHLVSDIKLSNPVFWNAPASHMLENFCCRFRTDGLSRNGCVVHELRIVLI